MDPLSRHVFEVCEAMKAARTRAGVDAFIDSCESTGRPAYSLFVSGRDDNLEEIPFTTFMGRGAVLASLLASWIALID